jgi:hypothetical protein
MGLQGSREGVRPRRSILQGIEPLKEPKMELAHAIKLQGARVALKAEPAQDHCWQVAAIDRQPRPGGERRFRCLVGHATELLGSQVRVYLKNIFY